MFIKYICRPIHETQFIVQLAYNWSRFVMRTEERNLVETAQTHDMKDFLTIQIPSDWAKRDTNLPPFTLRARLSHQEIWCCFITV